MHTISVILERIRTEIRTGDLEITKAMSGNKIDYFSLIKKEIQTNRQPDVTVFQFYYPDVYLQINMFRAFSRPSSGAQWLQWQPLVLPSYRGDSRAVLVVGLTINYAPTAVKHMCIKQFHFIHSSYSNVTKYLNELMLCGLRRYIDTAIAWNTAVWHKKTNQK